MIEDQTAQSPATDPILARDAVGREHHLEVTEDDASAGLIIIRDDGMTRTLSIAAACDLAWQLVAKATSLRRLEVGDSDVGPLSSTY
jgi:hypothetical protein